MMKPSMGFYLWLMIYGCTLLWVQKQPQVSGQLHESPCQMGWRAGRRQLMAAVIAWNRSKCYDFTLYRPCHCLSQYVGPFNVSVRDGDVVSPNSDEAIDVPTVPDLFKMVRELCYKGCPFRGPAQCNVTYNEHVGYLTSLDYDRSLAVADDEKIYLVTDFQFCA